MDAYPVTGILIASEEAELGKKNMDNASEIKKRTDEKEKFFLKGYTCFNLHITTVYGIDFAKWENWRAKLEQKDGSLHELQLRNMSGVNSVPFYEMMGTTTIWNNNTYACINKELDLMPPYKVHLIPQFKDDDLKSCNVEWL